MSIFSRGLLLLLWGVLGAVQAVSAASPLAQQDEKQEINSRYLLMDTAGRAVTNEDFRGRFQLLTFGYTFCPDVCPTTLISMVEILQLLGEDAERLQALFVTVDPERDVPEVLKAYIAFFDTRILGLTGSPDLIKRTAQHFRVYYEKIAIQGQQPENYTIDHTAGMYLLGPDGQYIRKFSYGMPASSVAAEIGALIAEQRR